MGGEGLYFGLGKTLTSQAFGLEPPLSRDKRERRPPARSALSRGNTDLNCGSAGRFVPLRLRAFSQKMIGLRSRSVPLLDDRH